MLIGKEGTDMSISFTAY